MLQAERDRAWLEVNELEHVLETLGFDRLGVPLADADEAPRVDTWVVTFENARLGSIAIEASYVDFDDTNGTVAVFRKAGQVVAWVRTMEVAAIARVKVEYDTDPVEPEEAQEAQRAGGDEAVLHVRFSAEEAAAVESEAARAGKTPADWIGEIVEQEVLRRTGAPGAGRRRWRVSMPGAGSSHPVVGTHLKRFERGGWELWDGGDLILASGLSSFASITEIP